MMDVKFVRKERTINRSDTKVSGIGINDSTYVVKYTDDHGDVYRCPYYTKWVTLLRTVVKEGLNVDPGFIYFSGFLTWLELEEIKTGLSVCDKSNVVDHRIIDPVTKDISSDNMMLVQRKYNMLFRKYRRPNALYTEGVTWSRGYKRYRCRQRMLRKGVILDDSLSISSSNLLYREHMVNTLTNLALSVSDVRLQKGFLDKAETYKAPIVDALYTIEYNDYNMPFLTDVCAGVHSVITGRDSELLTPHLRKYLKNLSGEGYKIIDVLIIRKFDHTKIIIKIGDKKC